MKHLSERLERVKAAVLPRLSEAFGADQLEVFEHRGELSLRVPRERLIELMSMLRDDPSLRFDLLKDVCVVDWYRRNDRFEVVYNLWSIPHNLRLRVKCFVEEKHPHVESVVGLWESANWYEREAYDMHGVIFDGHPDLRRMYLPEDFVDPSTGEPLYPLRKEFPMMGVPGSMPMPERN
jgi:NADH-quinone oxidoreductase subunit C